MPANAEVWPNLCSAPVAESEFRGLRCVIEEKFAAEGLAFKFIGDG